MITITQFDPQFDTQEWDNHVKNSKNGTFLHLRSFIDYHGDRFEDCSLMAYDNRDKLVAVFPANRRGDTLSSHDGLTYGGWVLPLKHLDVVTMLEVMEAACNWAREHGFKHIRYRAVPHIYHRYPAEEDIYALFYSGARLVGCNVSTVIDLADRLPFDRGNKSSLNHAIASGVKVVESADFGAFWSLLSQVLKDRYKAVPVHSLEEIVMLKERFPYNIRLVLAYAGSELLSGVVLFEDRGVTRCQYIATSFHGRQFKSLTLLFDTLIDLSSSRGNRYFDFGTSNSNDGHELNSSLVSQKCRLGGRAITYNIYQLDL
ncbi:MAG: GNAT family N-acetyltransferase [Muribaculaceae bacterium]|nr:GNAT family N-acetyltransferase [Muribaculaceae bacterium]